MVKNICFWFVICLALTSCDNKTETTLSADEFNQKMLDLSSVVTDVDTATSLQLAINKPNKLNVINASISVGANILSRSDTDMHTCLSKSVSLSTINLSSALELFAVGGPLLVQEKNNNESYQKYIEALTKDISSDESSAAQDAFNKSAQEGSDMILGTNDRKSILHDWLACSRAFKDSNPQ